MKYFSLSDQIQIPVLGLGTWQLQGSRCEQAVEQALKIGYRHIDTADAYDNHQQVANGIEQSGVNRSELFVTTKLWWTDLQASKVARACKRALQELRMDYVDLYLIHWPNRSVPIMETLVAMQKLKDEGLIKAIGVSNFTIHHLQEAWECDVEIATNQVEFHPSMNQEKLKDFCDEQRILITAYSPIAQGYDLQLPKVKELAGKYRRSPSQVVLNWLRQKGMAAIPRSGDEQHLLDNWQSQEWELSAEDVKQLDSLNEDYRVVEPSFADFGY